MSNGGSLDADIHSDEVATSERTSALARSSLPQPSLDAMNGETLQCKVVVMDPLGLHMRPLAAFAKKANQFQCSVSVTRQTQRVNGKSPIELMLLAAEQGTELVLEVSGSDAAAALDVLAEILSSPGLDEPSASPLPPKG